MLMSAKQWSGEAERNKRAPLCNRERERNAFYASRRACCCSFTSAVPLVTAGFAAILTEGVVLN